MFFYQIEGQMQKCRQFQGETLLKFTTLQCQFYFKPFNPLSPNSDQHLISPHNITDSSNIQVTRMNEMITKDGMS